MRIGVFDSGVGGLLIARSIREAMPEYDYVYLGDTKRVPYGNRSDSAIHQFTKQAVNYLFKKERCDLIVVACNTASARAISKIQKETSYLPFQKKPKVLGVLVPAAEVASEHKKIGVLATLGTVTSRAFIHEIKKLNKKARILQNPAPMLVPLAEAGETKLALPFLKKYLEPFRKKGVEAVVLGCTHYPVFKKEIKKIMGPNVKVISQDEFVPEKLKDYLARHPEMEKKISRGGTMSIILTDKTQNIETLTRDWLGEEVKPKLVSI